MSSWWFFFTSYQLSLCNYYLLDISSVSFWWYSKRPQEWKHVTFGLVFIPTDWLLVWSWLSIVSHSCDLQIVRLYLDIWNENTLLPFHLVVMHLCLYPSTKLSERRSGCNECSKQVGMWAKSVSAFYLSRAVHVAPTQRRSPPAASRQYSLVMPGLPPVKTAVRLNLRATHRAACHTNSSHKGVRT